MLNKRRQDICAELDRHRRELDKVRHSNQLIRTLSRAFGIETGCLLESKRRHHSLNHLFHF